MRILCVLGIIFATAASAGAHEHYAILTDLGGPHDRAWVELGTYSSIGVQFRVTPATGTISISNVLACVSPDYFVSSADSTVPNLLAPSPGMAAFVVVDTVDASTPPNFIDIDSYAILHYADRKGEVAQSMPAYAQLHNGFVFPVGKLANPTWLYVAPVSGYQSISVQQGADPPVTYIVQGVVKIPLTHANTHVVVNSLDLSDRVIGLVVVEAKDGLHQTTVY